MYCLILYLDLLKISVDLNDHTLSLKDIIRGFTYSKRLKKLKINELDKIK